MRFQDKVVIVTGAGKGIGKVAAQMFADEGAKVVAAARTESEVEAAAAAIREGGGEAIHVRADIADPASVQALMQRVLDHWGRIDVLLNNAAMPGPVGKTVVSLVDMPLEDWDLVHGINTRGTMVCCKYALPSMIARKAGVIVNVSSFAGRQGLEGRTHYCSSKAAIIGFTRALAWDVAKHGIRVNCVVPGGTRTELLAAYIERLANAEGISAEAMEARLSAGAASQRMVTSEEVAAAMLFMASDAAAGMFGQSIDVNAGTFMT